jgi:hypothetical protein
MHRLDVFDKDWLEYSCTPPCERPQQGVPSLNGILILFRIAPSEDQQFGMQKRWKIGCSMHEDAKTREARSAGSGLGSALAALLIWQTHSFHHHLPSLIGATLLHHLQEGRGSN